MRKIITVCILIAVVAAFGADTQTIRFWSKTHPEWPPLPAPPSWELKFAPVPGGFVFDDTHIVYPAPPKIEKQAPAEPVKATYWLNTNALAGNPEAIEQYKRIMNKLVPEAQAEAAQRRPENEKSPGLKRHEELMAVLEQLKAESRQVLTNAEPPVRSTNAPSASQ
jgi:hypothetical protein